MIGKFQYKCRRCGQYYFNPEGSQEITERILMELVVFGKGGSSQTGGTVHLLECHRCEDGGLGLCDLQGLAIVEDI